MVHDESTKIFFANDINSHFHMTKQTLEMQYDYMWLKHYNMHPFRRRNFNMTLHMSGFAQAVFSEIDLHGEEIIFIIKSSTNLSPVFSTHQGNKHPLRSITTFF